MSINSPDKLSDHDNREMRVHPGILGYRLVVD